MEDFINSEYNNAGELFGLDAVKLTRMMQQASPAQQAQIVKKISQAQNVKESRGSRKDMEKHMGQFPKHVKEELKKGNLRFSDYIVYSIKEINSKTIKMFEPQDDKEVGIRNIANAKLPKNMVMVVSGIILLAGVWADPASSEAKKSIDFRSINTMSPVANGEFSFKANRKQLIPENQGTRCFVTDNNTTKQLGYYRLDNPRMVNDDELIEFTVELGTMLGLPQHAFLYVGLCGTVTTP